MAGRTSVPCPLRLVRSRTVGVARFGRWDSPSGGGEAQDALEDVDAGDVQLRKGLGVADRQGTYAGANVEHPGAGRGEPFREAGQVRQEELGEQPSARPADLALGQKGLVGVVGPGRAAPCREGGRAQHTGGGLDLDRHELGGLAPSRPAASGTATAACHHADLNAREKLTGIEGAHHVF